MQARYFSVTVTAFTIATLYSSTLIAQPANTVEIDAATCMSMAAASARLACFEAQARAAGVNVSGDTDTTATSPPAAPAALPVLRVNREAPAASPAQPAAADVAERTSTPAADADFGRPDPVAQHEELFSNISALREITPNQFQITLANGQVWRQVRPEQYRMRIGQEVRIYPSRWGKDYRLSASDIRGFIQVARVQ